MERFDCTIQYKLIYVYSVPDADHSGFLKVGETTLNSDVVPELLPPNCKLLNQAAGKRINGQTGTVSVKTKLEYTELAERNVNGRPVAFSDKDVHSVLLASGILKGQPNGETGDEWFKTDLETVKRAVKAVKDGRSSLSSDQMTRKPGTPEIVFREEQEDAVRRTTDYFKTRKGKEFLWFAKMRFGKTLTALEVIRREQFRRVIIVTHRPVVDDGWHEDYNKIFFKGNSEHPYRYEKKEVDPAYTFDEKTDSENDAKIRALVQRGDYFIYFASMQDLRGSKRVGGNFNKNNAVFTTEWDLIVIDEAHEGTQTELGSAVIKALRKKETRILALSGTPFNLLDQYGEENTYTWDYVMEQKKKTEWDLLHPGDHNPYAGQPQMHIFTYDLGEKLRRYVTDEYDSKAFNFREFFRVWHKGQNSRHELPPGAREGAFVHEDDVRAFLDLLVKEDNESGYPFASEAYRKMFRHTLWMVPGVKEARALSEMLREHPVFRHFGIANVAGEGDYFEETHSKNALDLVRDTIANSEYSITLSCGKLTTGVTVPEWTAVIMLSGSYSTAAAQYMQTIFRVQSAGSIDGKQKTDCYVFDFAPDRTLKVLTETVHLSRKPGRNDKKRREAMQEFLNFCPVIAVSGSKTRAYSVESMMEQIKQIYAERAVNSGFDDESIYDGHELLKLTELDAKKFNDLKDIIGSTVRGPKLDSVSVNDQGLTEQQISLIDDGGQQPEKKPKTPLTPEQQAERERMKQAREARKKAIDILRGISIRMPLLIYGADVPIDEDIDIERFVEVVDEESWKEFMPDGVTKEKFADFIRYYDRDVFVAAGKRIRRLAAQADKETPTRRVSMIAEIFRHFRNPDKETVLTPWRVVNMHMSDTLGGWCFFNEKFEDDEPGVHNRLEEPRFVDRGEVTKTVFGEHARVLEINSKSGLYPLYVAYSAYRQRLEDTCDDDWSPEECAEFWEEAVRENVYVICKTPMAKSITKRTLCGYREIDVNAHYFEDLVNMLKNKPEQFRRKISRGSYWGKDVKDMKFDAVVGNPPYQASLGGASPLPLYHLFVEAAMDLAPNYVSMITPSRWFNAGNGLDDFREKMLRDKRLETLHDYYSASNIFPNVEIKGGIQYFLWNNNHDDKCKVVSHYEDGREVITERFLLEDGIDTFIRNSELVSILHKVKQMEEESFSTLISSRDPFGYDIRLPGSMKIAPHQYSLRKSLIEDVAFYYNGWRKEGVGYVSIASVSENKDWIDQYKVLIPKAWGVGNISKDWLNPFIISPHSVCTETYLVIGPFRKKETAENVLSYIQTKFFHTLVATVKISQNAAKGVYRFVPLQDFSKPWTDAELYAKYNLTPEEIAFIEANVKPM